MKLDLVELMPISVAIISQKSTEKCVLTNLLERGNVVRESYCFFCGLKFSITKHDRLICCIFRIAFDGRKGGTKFYTF